MKIFEFMQEARDLINTPEKWTDSFLARDKYNLPVSTTSPDAVCFCSLGAIKAVFNKVDSSKDETNYYGMSTRYLLKAIEKEAGLYQSVAEFNDTNSHGSVMHVWDIAIALAKGEDA